MKTTRVPTELNARRLAIRPTASLAVLLIGIPLLCLDRAVVNKQFDSDIKLCVVSTLLLSVYGLLSTLRSARPRLVASVFWLFTYITAGVVPLAQLHTGMFEGLMDAHFLGEAQLIQLLAGVFFLAGDSLSRKRLVATPPWTPKQTPLYVPALRFLVIISIGLSVYYMVRTGGPAVFFENREALGAVVGQATRQEGTSQVQSAMLTGFGTVPILVFAILWLNGLLRRAFRRSAPNVGLGIAAVACNVIVNSPVANARYWFLTVLLGFFFGLPVCGVKCLRTASIAGIIVAVFVFPYSDVSRNAGSASNLEVVPVAEKLSTKDYDQWIMTANGLWWVERHGHTGGGQLVGSMLFFLPRTVWTDKAADTGTEIGRAMVVQNVNLSSPLPLEIWIDFGWPGLCLGLLVVGYTVGNLDALFSSTRSSRRWVLTADSLVPVIAGYGFILMRGPLLQAIARLAIMVLCHWAVSYISAGRRISGERPA